MRRVVLSLLSGTLALAVAGDAFAQAYPAHAWQSTYQAIPIPGGSPATPITLEGELLSRQAWQWSLPFEFTFNGTTHSKINIGEKGYVTFGANTVFNVVNSNTTNSFLSSSANPTDLVAAWWGDHLCDVPSGELMSQVVGQEPERAFVIQWHCSRRSASTGSSTRFEAQLWFFEGSGVIRASYGKLNIGGVGDFSGIAWGIKRSGAAGEFGPMRSGAPSTCAAGGSTLGCTGVGHFPHDATIQYGFGSGAAPVLARVESSFVASGAQLEYSAVSTFLNLGLEAAAVDYDLYLSRSRSVTVGAPGTYFLKRVGGEVPAVAGGDAGQASFTEAGVVEVPFGAYYTCAVFESDGFFGPAATLISCSEDTVLWGVDLSGAVLSNPTAAAAGDEVEVRLSLQNAGFADAGPFSYSITILPDDPAPGAPPATTEEIFVGRVEQGIAAGASMELVFTGDEMLTLPSVLRGAAYTFVLTVDSGHETGDVSLANNVAYSAQKMEIRKPKLSLGRTEYSFPDGECVYGEPISALLEVCNSGFLAAVGHHPGLVMGAGSNMSLIEDPIAASSPQSCDSPFSSNYHECLPVGGQAGLCLDRTCHYTCTRDLDCQGGQRCLPDPLLDEALETTGVKSCVNDLEAYTGGGTPCHTYRMDGLVPLANKWGKRYESGPQRFHFTADAYLALSEAQPFVFSTPEISCQEALPDLTPVEIESPLELVAGETYSLQRRIRNLRLIEQYPGSPRLDSFSFEYAYFLAAPGAEISTNQIPLPMVGGGSASIGKRSDNVFRDRVVVPEQLAPGLYQLGLIVDPHGEKRETSKANNVLVFPELIEVLPPTFEILPPALPTALLGAPYLYEFSARGGAGAYSWTAEGLPLGLELDSWGRLYGTPMDVGVFSFKLRVRSGDRSSERILAIRVAGPAALLEVSTSWLPPATRLRSYGGWIDTNGVLREGIPLAASGGLPPYRWEVDPADSSLPQGMVLDAPAGILRGVPTPLSRTSSFTVRVTDANGSWAVRRLELMVVDGDELVISSRLFSEGTTGQPYESCIEASGGDPEKPLSWSIEDATIPSGLEAQMRGRDACLVGTPDTCGNYVVRVSVEDPAGRSYESSLSLSVECGLLQLKRKTIPEVRRGEIVEIRLESTVGAPTFRLEEGSLPPGLSLSPNGTIGGQVDSNAPFGAYNALVSMADEAGRQGMAAVVIRVRAERNTGPVSSGGSGSSGCSSSGSGADGWMVLLAAAAIVGRGRRTIAGLGTPVFALVVAMGLWACGDDDTTPVQTSACEGVVCGDQAMSCDPADGLCKCGGPGGLFCTTDQRCVLEPEPHCGGGGLCDFVECVRGESCELATGECSCGGESCAEDEQCIDRTCTKVELCSDVRCDPGTVCDPDDGKCKCSGVLCYEGQSCIEGSCQSDPCSGVSCPTNSACSPEDGSCHCAGLDGPICQPGEACVAPAAAMEEADPNPNPEAFACVESRLCEATSCGGGTTCDPADGLCKCGGVGALAPVCFTGQTCIDGQCMGGLLCEPNGVPTECSPGLSCDPKDGVCKCGGVDGVVCGPEESCTYSLGIHSCRRSCEVVVGAGGSCELREGCYIDRTLGSGLAFCAPAGVNGVNADCDDYNDCTPGLYCSQAKKCRRFCHPSEGDLSCADVPNSICLPFRSNEAAQPDLGYCIADVG